MGPRSSDTGWHRGQQGGREPSARPRATAIALGHCHGPLGGGTGNRTVPWGSEDQGRGSFVFNVHSAVPGRSGARRVEMTALSHTLFQPFPETQAFRSLPRTDAQFPVPVEPGPSWHRAALRRGSSHRGCPSLGTEFLWELRIKHGPHWLTKLGCCLLLLSK